MSPIIEEKTHCTADPDCPLPTKFDAFIIQWNEDTEKKKEDRSKLDKMCSSIEKMEKDFEDVKTNVNGNDHLGVKPLRKEIQEIRQYMWFPKMVDAFVGNIKRPFSWVIFVFGLFSVFVLLREFLVYKKIW